jgi:uncharacterized protein YraI
MTHNRIRWLAVLALASPALALAQDAFVTTPTNVRAGPDVSYPVVARLGPRTQVGVDGCLSDYSWCDVYFGPSRGWVYAGNLAYYYQNRPAPLLSYGATIGVPIVTFSLGSYWDHYYHDRPWYGRRDYWEHRVAPRAEWYGGGRQAYGQPYRQGNEWHGGNTNQWHGNAPPPTQSYQGQWHNAPAPNQAHQGQWHNAPPPTQGNSGQPYNAPAPNQNPQRNANRPPANTGSPQGYQPPVMVQRGNEQPHLEGGHAPAPQPDTRAGD